MKVEAEAGVKCLQAKEHQGLPEPPVPGCSGKAPTLWDLGDRGLADTVTPGVRPPEL